MRLVVWYYYIGTPLFFLGDVLFGWSVRVAFLDQFRAGRYAYYGLCWILGFVAWRAPRYATRLALLECSANLGLLILSVAAWYLQVLDWAGSERVAVEVPGFRALVNFVLVAAVGAVNYYVQRARDRLSSGGTMHVASVGTLGLITLAAAGCKLESTKRKEVRECVAISLSVQGAAACLEARYDWKKAAALAAAQSYKHQLDSVAQVTADSAWRAEAARRRREVEECRGDQSRSLARCLQEMYNWSETRATATDDSLWRHDAAKHQDEVQQCLRRRDMNTASCLQLYYKWSAERALALNDSLQRARLR